jgi:hypothetical protein
LFAYARLADRIRAVITFALPVQYPHFKARVHPHHTQNNLSPKLLLLNLQFESTLAKHKGVPVTPTTQHHV